MLQKGNQGPGGLKYLLKAKISEWQIQDCEHPKAPTLFSVSACPLCGMMLFKLTFIHAAR